MGKIPMYSSNQLASSAVGVPSQDRSGQIIAEGVGQAAQTAAAFFGQRQEKADALKVSAMKGDLANKYEKRKLEVAAELAKGAPDDYKKLPEMMKEEGAKIIGEMAQGLQGNAAIKFKEMGDAYLASDIPSNYALVEKRQNQIIQGDALTGYHNIAFQAGQIKDPVKFEQYLNGGEQLDPATNQMVRVPGALEQHSKTALPFFSAESILALEKQTRDQGIKQHLYSRLEDNPYTLYQDLESGKYDKAFADKPEEKKLWEDKVISYRKTMDERTNLKTALAGSGELLGLIPKIDSDEISLNQLEFSRDYAIQNKDKFLNGNKATPVVPKWYLPAIENLIDYAVKQPPAPEHTQQAEEVKARWIEHLNAPDETDGAAGSIQDHEKVMVIYADATKLLKEGRITKAEFQQIENQMETQITSKVTGTVSSSRLSEVVSDAKWPFHVASDNLFDIGVRVIHDGIEGKMGISSWGGRQFPNENAKRQTYLDAITALTQRIKSDDILQTQLNGMTRTEKVNAMRLLVWGVSDPRTGKVIKPGIVDRMGLIYDASDPTGAQPIQLGARKIIGGVPMIVGAIGIQGEAVWIPENKQAEKAFGETK